MRYSLTNKTRAALGAACLLLLAAACQDAEYTQPQDDAVQADDAMAGAINTLTEAEKAEGWQLLFDGQDLSQWRGFRQDSVPDAWQVADGAIHCTGAEGPDLITKEQFANFDLRLAWKIAPGGNSGIIYRADEDHDTPWATGPEVQVLDDATHPDARNGPKRLSGANYDVHGPARNVVHPAGEWNEARILVDGPHVEHWLNGEKIVDYELWTDEWKELVAGSKWKDHPDYGMVKNGHIALQNHGDEVWFRDVKIRRLPDAAAGG